MRTVGHRQTEPMIEAQASSDALRRGLAVVDAAATFGWATSTGQRKGVYRFKTFEEMEADRIDCLARAMAQRVTDEITVDLLFSPCAQTYEMLKPYEQVVDLDGVPVRTVSLEGLLLTKQSQRPQDVQDSLILRRAIEEVRRR